MTDQSSAKSICAVCGKVVADANGLYMHTKKKHGRAALKALPRPERDDEPSIGSLVAEAQINRALGLPVEEWIADMFDV